MSAVSKSFREMSNWVALALRNLAAGDKIGGRKQ